MGDLSPIKSFSIYEGFVTTIEKYFNSKVEIERIQAQKELMREYINNHFDTLNYIITRIFDERKMVIEKIFEVIDEGMRKDDRELIISGLDNLAKIVTTSPLKDFETFKKIFNSPKGYIEI